LGQARVTEGTPPIVVGFPEIVAYQYRCRLCKLANGENPGLVRVIHGMYKQEGLSLNAVRQQANKLLAKHGETPISDRGVRRHFEAHVNFGTAPLAVAAVFEPPPLHRPEADEARMYMEEDEKLLKTVADDRAALGYDFSDYKRINDLFLRLYRRIEAIDADPTAFRNGDGEANGYKLVMWVKLIDSARMLISDLNKMRNSDRLTLDMLHGHTKRLSIKAIDDLQAELGSVIAMLEQSDDEFALRGAKVLEAIQQQGVISIFTSAASDTLQQSIEEFNLH
jgi:hypothetical protein